MENNEPLEDRDINALADQLTHEAEGSMWYVAHGFVLLANVLLLLVQEVRKLRNDNAVPKTLEQLADRGFFTCHHNR